MTAFEKWQVALGITSAALLLAAFLGALYVGLKQNEINERLLDLQYMVAIEVTHESGRVSIANKGTTNLLLWGTKVGAEQPRIEENGRLITPGGWYYLNADRLDKLLLETAGKVNQPASLPLEIYVETANRRKWTVHCLLLPELNGETLAVHTQTVSMTVGGWGGK